MCESASAVLRVLWSVLCGVSPKVHRHKCQCIGDSWGVGISFISLYTYGGSKLPTHRVLSQAGAHVFTVESLCSLEQK